MWEAFILVRLEGWKVLRNSSGKLKGKANRVFAFLLGVKCGRLFYS
jgi:hypothetical protein